MRNRSFWQCTRPMSGILYQHQGRIILTGMVMILLSLSGCVRFENYVKQRSDKAAYGIINRAQVQELGEGRSFSLSSPQPNAYEKLSQNASHLNLAETAFDNPTYEVSLSDALAIALAKNREYLTRKELLYKQALALTGTRWNYRPQFNTTGSAAYQTPHTVLNKSTSESGTDLSSLSNESSTKKESTSSEAEKVQTNLELLKTLLAQLPEKQREKYNVEHYGSNDITTGVKRQLATGAQISLDYTHSFVQQLTGGGTSESNNTLGFDVVQPLLRGCGSLVAREELRQSEKDMVYAVRNFALYEQDFVIDIVSAYFNILTGLDAMNNAQANCKSASANYDLLQIQLKHRICSQLETDQALQKTLDAEALWINTRTAYQSHLDQFKMLLGIDLSFDLGPDKKELEILHQKGMVRPSMTLDQAIKTSLEQRLDYRNAKEQEEDAQRHIKVALRQFLPSVDLRYNLVFFGQKQYALGMNSHQYTDTWGIDLGAPLDWTARRNTYRTMVISHDQAQRALEATHDQIILDVREQWRQLDRLKRRVEIAQQSVELAKRRVDGTQMMLAAGQTTAREMADVQDELLNAQNSFTSDLVEYTLYRLKFWRAIGCLNLSENVHSGMPSISFEQ